MAVLSRQRAVPYVVAGLVVAAVGFWGLKNGIAGGSEPEATLVTTVLAADSGGRTLGGAGSEGRPGDPAAEVSSTTTLPRLFVQVAGAVARPGVYEVEPGARVFQVLLLAGGATADADEASVPLAALVVDGGRIWVPRVGEVPGAADVGGAAPGAAGTGPIGGTVPAKVVLSTAGEAELDTLPGVGPKTAQQIIAYRDAHGPFTSVEQLEDVPGIGPATVERLRDLVVP